MPAGTWDSTSRPFSWVDPANGTRPEGGRRLHLPAAGIRDRLADADSSHDQRRQPQFLTWEVKIARTGSEEFTTIATGAAR